jgi:hypothetical protein
MVSGQSMGFPCVSRNRFQLSRNGFQGTARSRTASPSVATPQFSCEPALDAPGRIRRSLGNTRRSLGGGRPCVSIGFGRLFQESGNTGREAAFSNFGNGESGQVERIVAWAIPSARRSAGRDARATTVAYMARRDYSARMRLPRQTELGHYREFARLAWMAGGMIV